MSGFDTSLLNPQQREAVKTINGPVLILAGAGSGKTRTVTARIAHMLDRGVDPFHILAVTFTNKAAGEMKARVRGMVGKKAAGELTVCTFHSLCVRILREDIEKLGYKKNFTIYASSDQIALIKKLIVQHLGKDSKLDAFAVSSAIGSCKNSGLMIDPLVNPDMEEIATAYGREMKLLNAVDFDDLLILGLEVLRDFPDVRRNWQARFRYVMVDEFQDTNHLQMSLLKNLVDHEHNICVVGDDDQSIYGWRGAEMSNILEFEKHFPNPKVVLLEENYRSHESILNVSNSLIRHNRMRREKSLWSNMKGGERVRLLGVETDRKEAEFVTEELWERANLRKMPWEDFAILFRTNMQSRVMEEELRKRKIPYRIVGTRSFFDRREVRDILGYLTLLVNPDDDIALLRVINSPARGIGDTTIEAMQEYSINHKCSIWKALENPLFLTRMSGRAVTSIRQFIQMVNHYRAAASVPGTDGSLLLQKWLAEMNYEEFLGKTCKTQEEADGRREVLKDLIVTMGDYLRNNPQKGIVDFLRDMALDDRDEDDKDDITKKKGVCLITLHAAKGLEFPEVYLIGLEEGILPHRRSIEENRKEEERRLLYVGITRAMRRLTMTHCHYRQKYGDLVPCVPSGFLVEIDPETIHVINHEEMANEQLEDDEMRSFFEQMKAMVKRK